MPKESLTLPPDIHPPTRYVEKVNLVTGEVLDEPILPKHLLINNHRDFHILDIYSRYLIGRAVERTGDPPKVLRKMKKVRRLGQKAVELLSTVVGEQADFIGKKLFGYKAKEYFFRYRSSELSEAEAEARIQGLREEAQKRLDRCKEGDRLALRVLLTGGTGFLGKEIICQAAEDPEIDEMYILIRPKEIRDRNTKKVLQVLSPTERGAILLRQLWLENHPARGKFRFIDGDIEKPDLGIHSADLDQIRARVTHVIHCAASVSFDDTYENSFRANVRGALNAAELSSRLWASAGSRFVCHVAIETSYIHGRQTGTEASEGNMVFPRNFFNNYYEVTKAMGSMETDWYMLDHGLPVTQLCPSIVVGHSRNGNNRGDTKVVNAPVNAFGRAQQALRSETGSWSDRSKAHVLASIACVFPADRSAELNLVSVDRVSAGILAALKTTAVIGTRTHLATDNRLTSAAIQRIAKEEIEVTVKLSDPTLHRTVTLPIITKILTAFDQPKMAGALKTLGTIFGSYGEWGQPVHEVGNDVTLLGLPLPRPNTENVFRMVCRHNRFVQNFGQIRDDDEISRREKIWSDFVTNLETETGEHVGQLPPLIFRERLEKTIDPETFTLRTAEDINPSSD